MTEPKPGYCRCPEPFITDDDETLCWRCRLPIDEDDE